MLVNFVTHKVAECSAIKKEWSHHKMFVTECHTCTTFIILQLSGQDETDKCNSVIYDIYVAQCHTQCHLQQRSISLLQMSAWDETSPTLDDIKLHSGHLALVIQVLNVVSSGIRAAEHLYVDIGMGKATYRDAGSRHQCEHERQM